MQERSAHLHHVSVATAGPMMPAVGMTIMVHVVIVKPVVIHVVVVETIMINIPHILAVDVRVVDVMHPVMVVMPLYIMYKKPWI